MDHLITTVCSDFAGDLASGRAIASKLRALSHTLFSDGGYPLSPGDAADMMYRCLSLYRDTASDTAETCCIDIPLCEHVRRNVSAVSAVSTIGGGVKLGVKVME